MRTKEEIKLLKIRQNLRDAINYLKAQEVIDLKMMREVKLQFKITEQLLLKIRKKEIKTV